MSSTPLFSTYRQSENRVTSSMLAVFERIGLSLVEEILAKASGEATLETVTFTNQPKAGKGSVPDARISADFTYLLEVKTVRGTVDARQLRGHVENLEEGPGRYLFVLTPDPERPAAVEVVRDRRVVWFNFAALDDAITAVVDDAFLAPAERDRFLLRELQALFDNDGLLTCDEVVVVAASQAYPEYLESAAYICQPGRAFREGLTHMGFYAQQAIQPHLARILTRQDHVPFTPEEAQQREDSGGRDARIADLIRSLLESGVREEGQEYMVFLLSGPEDPETVVLEVPLVNDTVAASGRSWAWTMGQRYVSLAALRRSGVRTTSDLDVS
ncbi:hypothetical protein NE857_26345 [Nocardiopsis exhalans]|uniref:Uncharacterized protein n=2 Tax=Nocardiopsis TaxID=2013 RepID=A0A840W5R9_9ACTN|nr:MULTISPECIES: hypothetical protein [Nocardiopsis]MBB5492319.1 hypothetical protein [Nocardiopsis metallicus]USY18773.1 hypothetical protein NE857_26345 [Nocardiopsis exhalans]